MGAKKKGGGQGKGGRSRRAASNKRPPWVKFKLRAQAVTGPEPAHRYALPKIGDIILLNESAGQNYSRAHGGRHPKEGMRRYFAVVADIYPHVVLLDTGNGYLVSESVSDIRLGLVRYIRLKRMPEDTGSISYDERLLSAFVGAFEEMLME